MTTQFTPYETQPTPDPEPRRSSATQPLMILLAVIGGIILLGLLATTILSSVIGLSRGTASTSADANGVTALNIEADASRFDLEFGPVPEATLQIDGVGADRWELDRSGDELNVYAPDRWWTWCFFDCDARDNQVTLTLPQELNDGSLDADLDLNAGRLYASGDFNELTLELNAGEANVDGATRTLDAQLNAGRANLNMADVEAANLEVAAGRLDSEFTGTAPTTTEIDVSAGQLVLNLPDETYTVTSDVAAGSLDNDLTTASDAQHQINVDLAAGNVTLQPGEVTHN